MNKFLLITLSATGVFAAASNPFLAERAYYQVPCSDQGEKDCGDGCIQPSWTCCPDGSGGCPSDASCYLGTNGEYGCCPKGENCEGEGGATTNAYTNTIIVSETSTAYGSESTTTEGSGYEQPPTETETATYYSSVVESTAPSEATTTSYYSQPDTMKTETQTYVYPSNTTPAPVVPTTPGSGTNGTKPVQTSEPPATSVIVNGAASYGINVVGGLLAGIAAFLI